MQRFQISKEKIHSFLKHISTSFLKTVRKSKKAFKVPQDTFEMLRTLSLAVKVKTSPDSIWRVQCLSKTFLQELQTLLNVNTFFFPLRKRGGQHYWPSLAARETKHVIGEQFVQENTVTVLGVTVLHFLSSRLNCCFRLEIIVKLWIKHLHCKWGRRGAA